MSNIHFLGDNEGEDINELSDKKIYFQKPSTEVILESNHFLVL